jgi:uncharacterized protein YbaP (TraB family)
VIGYLLGGLHNKFPVQLPLVIESAILKSDVLVTELGIDQFIFSENVVAQKYKKIMIDHSLIEIFGLEIFERLLVNFDNYQEISSELNAIAPSQAINSVILKKCPVTLGFDLGIERHLVLQAINRGIPVEAIETLDDQLEAMRQIDPLEWRKYATAALSAIENPSCSSERQREINRTADLLFSGDLSSISASLGREWAILGSTEVEQGFGSWRNPMMAMKIQKILDRRKKPFFIVGVAHLFGKKNLVTELTKLGLKLEPARVKKN